VVRLAAPGKVRVRAKAWWQFPLRRAEVVQDGRVVGTREPAGEGELVWEQEVAFERSGWLALRATGPAGADLPRAEGYAHTSPVYVDVAGHPPAARADAQFFLKWIDRLDVALRERDRLPSAADKARVAAQLEAARAVYGKLAR
jgi:hypothetical protein